MWGFERENKSLEAGLEGIFKDREMLEGGAAMRKWIEI